MERAPLNSWAQMLELVDGNSPGLQHMTKGEYLSIRQVAPESSSHSRELPMGRLWTAQVALSWVTVPSALAVVQWSNNTGTTDGG